MLNQIHTFLKKQEKTEKQNSKTYIKTKTYKKIIENKNYIHARSGTRRCLDICQNKDIQKKTKKILYTCAFWHSTLP